VGIAGEIYTYISNFLAGRTIHVGVGNQFSKVVEIKNGTPQGSVISPILFLIMINDLPAGITDVELTLFADDSCCLKSGRKLDVIIRHVQNSLHILAEWCDQNCFKISFCIKQWPFFFLIVWKAYVLH